jgi:hypothetical protein
VIWVGSVCYLLACRVCSRSRHTWEKLTQRACLSSTGLTKLFVASSQISSLYSQSSMLAAWSKSRYKLIENNFSHFAPFYPTYLAPWKHYLILVLKFQLVIVWCTFIYLNKHGKRTQITSTHIFKTCSLHFCFSHWPLYSFIAYKSIHEKPVTLHSLKILSSIFCLIFFISKHFHTKDVDLENSQYFMSQTKFLYNVSLYIYIYTHTHT